MLFLLIGFHAYFFLFIAVITTPDPPNQIFGASILRGEKNFLSSQSQYFWKSKISLCTIQIWIESFNFIFQQISNCEATHSNALCRQCYFFENFYLFLSHKRKRKLIRHLARNSSTTPCAHIIREKESICVIFDKYRISLARVVARLTILNLEFLVDPAARLVR